MRKGDTELLAKINTSLAKLKANGTVEKILDKWGPKAGFLMQAFWRDTVEFLPILMSGVALTIIVTIGSLCRRPCSA